MGNSWMLCWIRIKEGKISEFLRRLQDFFFFCRSREWHESGLEVCVSGIHWCPVVRALSFYSQRRAYAVSPLVCPKIFLKRKKQKNLCLKVQHIRGKGCSPSRDLEKLSSVAPGRLRHREHAFLHQRTKLSQRTQDHFFFLIFTD